jgi:uncharacterized protein (TIGR02001 family)
MAQVSGSATLVSDYRVRGVTLSAGRPAAQLDLGYDDASGLYAGAFASSVQFYEHSQHQAQLTGYSGFAQRLPHGWSADGGAAYTTFSGGEGYNYLELHAGITRKDVSARLYFSPNYFGQNVQTLYAELNGSYPLAERFRLIGHAGVLQVIAGATDYNGGSHPHADLLGGVQASLHPFTLQLSRIAGDGAKRVYPVGARHPSGVWTARLSFAF